MADVQVLNNGAAVATGGAGLNPQQFIRTFNAMPAGRKLGLLGMIAMVLTGVIAAFFLSTQPVYKPLFAGLADEDAGAVTAALTQMNVPYRISDSGNAILVPAEFVHEARLKMATQGLPKGRIAGFEILDGQKMGVTQFQEQVNYQRALEGELVRSIQSLGAVKGARVHLAIPKPSVFLRDQNKPTASVVVNLYPGRALERQQIQGIVHLVSSSVPELSARNVSIVDQNGNLLTTDSTVDEVSGLGNAALQYQQSLEQLYMRRVMDMLVPVYGADNVRATVTADLDFSRVERSEETFRPNTDLTRAAIRSEQISENREADGANPSGIPGMTSNTPPGGAQAPIGGARPGTEAPGAVNARASRRDATTNYELDRATTTTRPQVGALRRLSVAVLINDRAVMGETADGKSLPLTQDEINKVSSLVREAIGYSEQRGDKVNVVNQSFNVKSGEAPEALDQKAAIMDLARSLATPLIAGLVAIALIFGVMRPMLKAQERKLAQASDASAQAGADGSDAANGANAAAGNDPLLAGQGAAATPALPTPGTEDDGVSVELVSGGQDGPVLRTAIGEQRQVEEVRRLARENPQLVANIVASWMEMDA